MVQFFDLHNDCLVSKGRSAYDLGADKSTVSVVHAIFTQGMTVQDFVRCKQIALAQCLELSVEDCSIFSMKDLQCVNGARMASLTWNYDNAYAGGAYGIGRLTKQGKSFVGYLEQNGIALDLAHLNRASYFDALDTVQKPPLVSHCGLSCSVAHVRNLTDEQVRALIAAGGVVGLCLVPQFYGRDSAEEWLDTVDAYCQKFGHKSLCIGTDFYGTEHCLGGIMHNAYRDLRALLDGLTARGYTEIQIADIAYGNFEAYLNRLT